MNGSSAKVRSSSPPRCGHHQSSSGKPFRISSVCSPTVPPSPCLSAHRHSSLSLIVLTIQGSVWTATDYLYSTSLFWLTGAVLFYIAAQNFKDERLFSEKPLATRGGGF